MDAEEGRPVRDESRVLMEPDIGAGIEVCVVEDDADLREELVAGLGDFGFAVRGFGDAISLYRGLLQMPCDVMVVDIGLPHEDGFAVAASLRAISNVGIVFLTGRSAVEDRIRGLMDGGDAYVVKPVDLHELVAILLSVRRRMVAMQPAMATTLERPATGQGWTLQSGGWALLAPNGVSVTLTTSERALMQSLFDQADEVVSREALVVALGHRSDYYLNHRLNMLVSRLRRKVQDETGCVLPLRAVRGRGFILSRSEA